jgi:hypothetical protein
MSELDNEAMKELAENGRLKRADILLSTTPADIANCDKLSWKYLVKDGKFYEVSSKEEVDAIIKPKKRA